jgi:hypothetical protein
MLGIDIAAGGLVLAALTFGFSSVQSIAKEAHNMGLKSARLEGEIELLKSRLIASLDLVSYRLGQVEKSINCSKELDK